MFGHTLKKVYFCRKSRVRTKDLVRCGYDVYIGTIKDKEVDFVATKNDRTIYLQVPYLLIDEGLFQY